MGFVKKLIFSVIASGVRAAKQGAAAASLAIHSFYTRIHLRGFVDCFVGSYRHRAMTEKTLSSRADLAAWQSIKTKESSVSMALGFYKEALRCSGIKMGGSSALALEIRES